MAVPLNKIERIANRRFFNQISNSGGDLLQTSWSQNIKELGFAPDFAIVRTIIYNTASEADPQIYEIKSSLVGYDSIGSFPGSNTTEDGAIAPIISNPQRVLKLSGGQLNSISFNIVSFATDGTNISAAPDGLAVTEQSSILIEIDFIRLK